jgi:hypothetical protein
MFDFETDLDVARSQGQRTIRVSTSAPRVRETVTVTRDETLATEVRTTDVGKNPAEWNWEDLRNYVVRQIQTFHGEFPIDQMKLSGIFKGFLRRHGAMAGPIAVAAFDLHHGRWKGAPISVTRFCAGSDPYFAEPIKRSLLG